MEVCGAGVAASNALGGCSWAVDGAFGLGFTPPFQGLGALGGLAPRGRRAGNAGVLQGREYGCESENAANVRLLLPESTSEWNISASWP